MILFLSFLIKPKFPEAQLAVHHCSQFSAETKLAYNKAAKWEIKYLKGTTKKGPILKPNTKEV